VAIATELDIAVSGSKVCVEQYIYPAVFLYLADNAIKSLDNIRPGNMAEI
jgi:hypothetical protein